MTAAEAEEIAVRALAWIAAREDILRSFLVAGGISPDDLRGAASSPDFLAAVLDHVLREDGWVVEFARETLLEPVSIAAARRALPGGQDVSWT